MSESKPRLIEDLPEIATPAQVRSVLQLSFYQLQCLIRERRIGYIPVGSRVLIPRESVRQFLTENTIQPELPPRTFDVGSDRTERKARAGARLAKPAKGNAK